MYSNKRLFLLVVSLFVLVIGISAVCATDIDNQASEDIVDTQLVDAIDSQLRTTEKIDTTSVVESDTPDDNEITELKTSEKTLDNSKLSVRIITVTNGTFFRYFNDYGTTNNIQENDSIILVGNFTDKIVYLDKSGLTLTSTGGSLINSQVVVNEEAENSTVTGVTIDSTGYERGISVYANNVNIVNNHVTLTNDDIVTEGITSEAINTTIANNFVNVTGPSIDIDWNGGERDGLAYTFGIFASYADNCLIENNTVYASKAKNGKDEAFGTIDGIELKGAEDVTVNNNTVYVSDARFVYGINALDHVSNTVISNNKITVTSERYVAGIQVGNSVNDINITGNKIKGVCHNTTIFYNDDESLGYGIITSNMAGNVKAERIVIDNNEGTVEASIVYTIEIYETQFSNITNNRFTGVGNYSMGINFAHSNDNILQGNTFNVTGDNRVYVNEIVEEIRPANKGVQVQQDSNNLNIIGNNLTVVDEGGSPFNAIYIESSKNINVTDNSVVYNDNHGTDAITVLESASDVVVSNNTSPKSNKDAIVTLDLADKYITGTEVTFKATVTDAQTNEKINGKLAFKLNYVTLKDSEGNRVKVDVIDGIATVSYNLTGFTAKEYTLTAVFGNESYNRAEDNEVISVSKTNVTTQLTPMDVYADEVVLINQTITDANGNVASGKIQVAIKVNDITVLKTDAYDGLLLTNITIPKISEGTSKLTIVLADNSRYEKNTIETTLNVLKQDVEVEIETVTAKPGETVELKAMLTNAITKTPVSSGNYVFKINGHTIPDEFDEFVTAKVENGIATWNYIIQNDFEDGAYEVTLAYSGNSLSNSVKYSQDALIVKA